MKVISIGKAMLCIECHKETIKVNGMKKQIAYIFQRSNADINNTLQKKEQLKKEGYLVITIKEGPVFGLTGMKEVIKNHIS